MNLKNKGQDKIVVDKLNGMDCFKRIAGFGSSIMKNQAPDLYSHYVNNLGKLHCHNPLLKCPFSSSMFSAATYNLGPQTLCYKHRDFQNLPYGWCAVTMLGLFDYTKGGHLILWDCNLVVEFPPGATILLLSAIVAHSNVAISEGKQCYSFAQYSTGALFQWVENDYKTAICYKASLSHAQRVEQEKRNSERWSLGLSLLPVVNLSQTQLADVAPPVD